MASRRVVRGPRAEELDWLSAAAVSELGELGLVSRGVAGPSEGLEPVPGRDVLPRRAVRAPEVLNEAYDYDKPSAFSRGLRVELPGASMILLSGTAAVDEHGRSVHTGDFPAQCLRTFRNLTRLLVAEGASWHDVVRTTCYLRDIDRDYEAFNRVRSMFMESLGLDPLPASTGIEARLCRPELLIEIEAIALVPRR